LVADRCSRVQGDLVATIACQLVLSLPVGERCLRKKWQAGSLPYDCSKCSVIRGNRKDSVVRFSQGIVLALAWVLLALPEPASGQSPSDGKVELAGVAKPAPDEIGDVLSIEVKLSDRKLSGDGALILQDVFDVNFVNNSDRPLEICNPDVKEGWSQLSFELTDLATGQRYVIRRRPVSELKRREFTRGPEQQAERITIRPDGGFSYQALLSDCQHSDRDWVEIPKTVYRQRFSFKARFESSPSPRQTRNLAWVGKIESPSQTVRVVDWQPQPPHYYLERGLTQKALEILKADSFWTGKRDPESSRTLLQIAATRNGYPEVVKWLVDNGAEVNTAVLHSAENPVVIALLLAKHPNLEDSSLGGTVLLQAARAWLAAKRPEERRKWQTIMDMYRRAGAEYDILTAIQLNDFDRVKAVLAKSPQVARQHDPESPLRAAASLGRLEICRYLIERCHVDVNEFQAGYGFPIIKQALASPEIVRLLIAGGADLKTRITWREFRSSIWIVGDNATALHYAAADGVPESVQLLIDNGVDIFATADPLFSGLNGRKNDQTALDIASIFGKAENVAAIVHHPKFPRADTRRRKEVLDRCLACRRWYGHSIRQPVERWRLLQTLLECGADPNAKVDGMTAIQRAAGEIGPDQDTGNPEASPGGDAQNDEIRKEIDVLRKHGAAIDLVSAVAIGDEAEVARLLKQNPRSASSRRLDGYPVLHWSVTMNYEGIVKQLLDAGCDVEIRNRSRHTACDGTALHEAACWGRFSIAKMLLAHGAKVNAISANHQWTPLHEAAYAGDAKVAGLLLRNGANLDAKDDEGNTPLQVCQAKSRRQAVALRAVFREYARTAKGGSRR